MTVLLLSQLVPLLGLIALGYGAGRCGRSALNGFLCRCGLFLLDLEFDDLDLRQAEYGIFFLPLLFVLQDLEPFISF